MLPLEGDLFAHRGFPPLPLRGRAIAYGVHHGGTEDTEKRGSAREARHPLLLRVLRASVVNLSYRRLGRVCACPALRGRKGWWVSCSSPTTSYDYERPPSHEGGAGAGATRPG